MKYLTILQIALCYIIANQNLIGQNCKLAKDELDPFTKKQVVLTKTFNMANPITSEARKQLYMVNLVLRMTIFISNSKVIVSGGILADTDNLK